MDWGAVEAIAEIVGLLLVVVSLLFVGFQLRQNTQQLRQDNLLKTIRGTLDTNWYYHRDPAAFQAIGKGCEDFDALAPQDQALFHSVMIDLSFYLGVVMQMQKLGLIEPAATEINLRYFLGFLSTPGGQKWWEIVKQTRPMPDDVMSFIQSELDRPGRAKESIQDLQPWLAG